MFEKAQKVQHRHTELPPRLQPRELLELPSQEQSELVSETYTAFRDTLIAAGYQEYTEITELYRKLGPEALVVRREDPERVFQLAADREAYTISFEGDRYANCVEWSPADGARNMQNAYHEGYGQANSIVTVVGISNQDESLSVEHLPDSVTNFHGLERQGVRSMQGTVRPEMIRFVSLRIPGHLFPEKHMTEDELDELFEYRELLKQGKRAAPFHVHRGYIAPRADLKH